MDIGHDFLCRLICHRIESYLRQHLCVCVHNLCTTFYCTHILRTKLNTTPRRHFASDQCYAVSLRLQQQQQQRCTATCDRRTCLLCRLERGHVAGWLLFTRQHIMCKVGCATAAHDALASSTHLVFDEALSSSSSSPVCDGILRTHKMSARRTASASLFFSALR